MTNVNVFSKIDGFTLEHHLEEDDVQGKGTLREILPALGFLFLACLMVSVVFLLPGGPLPPATTSRRTSKYLSKPVSPDPLESNDEEGPDAPDLEKTDFTSQFKPTITTSTGTVQGSSSKVLGKKVNAFLGIPFARPPVGPLRFRRPEPVARWRGIYPANTFSEPCVQYRPSNILTPWISSSSNGSEDCLYLNLWAPEVSRADAQLKAVMVWIYGGAFFSGSSDIELYNGEYLASFGDVLVASFNYRLGALGFLNANSEEAPGNMGMYDQVMALKWIQSNIEYFGGDPENIVLFGQSAGATSAGLHMFSPLTRDIAKRVILQSGSPLFPKIYFENSLQKSNDFAKLTGCADNKRDLTNEPRQVLECLQKLDVDSLIASHYKVVQQYKIPFFPHPGDEFLPQLPHDAIWDEESMGPQRELLLGNTEDEGSFFLYLFFPEVFDHLQIIDNLTLEVAQKYITEAYSFIPPNQAHVMSQFFLSKLGNAPKEVLLKATYDIIGDSGFICPAGLLSDILSDYNVSIYNYMFNHRPSTTSWGQWMGSTHMDEIEFVFGVPLKYPKRYSEEDVAFSRRIMSSWTQFAKQGNPDDQLGRRWPKYSRDEPLFMELNPRTANITEGPHPQACSLWKIIYESFL